MSIVWVQSGVSINKSVCSSHSTKISINQRDYDFSLLTVPFTCLGAWLSYSKNLDVWWSNPLLERWIAVRDTFAIIILLKAELHWCQFVVTSQKSPAYIHATVAELTALQSTLWVCNPRHNISCLEGVVRKVRKHPALSLGCRSPWPVLWWCLPGISG